MLRNVDNLLGLSVVASDGEAGHLHDLYFDDQTWTIRYLVADTGSWLFGRRVLISPQVARLNTSLEQPDRLPDAIHLALTQEQIENSPDINLNQPVSRQHEVELHGYYGWLGYWQVDPLVAPVGATPHMPMREQPAVNRSELVDAEMADADGSLTATDASNSVEPNSQEPARQEPARQEPARQEPDSHLRSAREVMGYNIHATDNEIGHVEDMLLDEENYELRYLVVDTRNWLPGKQVLVATDWVREVKWTESAVQVGITRAQVENSPVYSARSPISREFEIELYNAYDLPGYWI